ncbi:hypothetical protein Tco_0323263 [Tanacetum coccineum]
MSTQQDIYATGSKNRPPMLNKENHVPWSSRLLRYAKSRPNGKLIYNSIMNDPCVRRMIPEPSDADREVEADDQAIQTILLDLHEDIYAVVDSCETAQEIWFTSIDGESIESYYHHFSKLMNDFKRNKHFPEKFASILKFLNNLQPEWSRHEVDDLRAERLAKTHDPLALMMVGGNGGNQFRQYAGQNIRNQNRLIVVSGIANQNPNGNGNVVATWTEGNANGNNAEEFDLMVAATDLDEIEETDQLSVEQSGETIYQHPATVEETRAYFESLYNNLTIEVEKVNTVNRKLRETNANLTTKLARYKNQEKCFEISQEKYDKLERCYQKSVYQEQCLTKKINSLHLSSGKQITTLNEEISNLNNQLSKEKSIVSSLQEEKKKLKSDFKIREDELLDKQIQLENK